MVDARKKPLSMLTPLRSAVLAVLVDRRGPVSAYELLMGLSKRRGKRVSPPTIYRSLDALLKAGLVGRIESRKVFFARSHHQSNEHGVIYSCQLCGRVDEIVDRVILSQVSVDAALLDFTVEREVLEVVGVCGDCRPAGSAEAVDA